MAEWAGSLDAHSNQGSLYLHEVYRHRSDSFQLYSHSDLPIRAPLPKVYQGWRHIARLFIQLQPLLINCSG